MPSLVAARWRGAVSAALGVMIGNTAVTTRRVTLSYSDQNESFAPFLPRDGTIRGPFTDTSGSSGWALVELDDPFSYQVKLGGPARFRGATVGHLLIRSRWDGYGLAGREPTSVFILLVEDSQLPLPNPFDVSGYIHAAWAMCEVA